MTNSRKVATGLCLLSALTPMGSSLAEPAASSASALPPAAPPPPVIDASWPREQSPTPTADEWKSAAPVSLTRQGRRAEGCRAHRVREWLKIHCPETFAASIAILGGNSDDVHFWTPPIDEHGSPQKGADLVMAVRPGDRRAIQVWSVGFGYEGLSGLEPGFVVSEQWLEGDPAPLVTTT